MPPTTKAAVRAIVSFDVPTEFVPARTIFAECLAAALIGESSPSERRQLRVDVADPALRDFATTVVEHLFSRAVVTAVHRETHVSGGSAVAAGKLVRRAPGARRPMRDRLQSAIMEGVRRLLASSRPSPEMRGLIETARLYPAVPRLPRPTRKGAPGNVNGGSLHMFAALEFAMPGGPETLKVAADTVAPLLPHASKDSIYAQVRDAHRRLACPAQWRSSTLAAKLSKFFGGWTSSDKTSEVGSLVDAMQTLGGLPTVHRY